MTKQQRQVLCKKCLKQIRRLDAEYIRKYRKKKKTAKVK